MDSDRSNKINEETNKIINNSDHMDITDVVVSAHNEDIDDTAAISHNGNLHFS